MLFYIDRIVETWSLPPGNILLLSVFGLILWHFRPRTGKFIVTFSIALLWMLSTPLIACFLLDNLQFQYPTLLPNQMTTADKDTAIVVLEASLNLLTPEYGEPTASENTLSRLRYAAFLSQKTGARVLVSGNDPLHPEINQADCMAAELKQYFNVSAAWKEYSGYNTAHEGIISTEILRNAGIKKLYLVSHALHMPRAVAAFRNRGIEIIPAPTGYKKIGYNLGIISAVLPNIDALNLSSVALREYIGIIWYKLYYHF